MFEETRSAHSVEAAGHAERASVQLEVMMEVSGTVVTDGLFEHGLFDVRGTEVKLLLLERPVSLL